MRNTLFLASVAVWLFSSAPALAGNASSPCQAGQKIAEERFVKIDGIEQWITIHGDDCANPAVFFVHGGPGNPSTPFAAKVYHAWEKDFVLVQWDQRGAGKTFERNPATADGTLTIELMARDGIAVASTVSQHLGKRKLILFGGSWGSALAVTMAMMKPELFAAYLGSSQMVAYRENQTATFQRIAELAKSANDNDTLAKLDALGPPPWNDPRAFGILRRALRKYEAKTTVPAPDAWWNFEPQYTGSDYQAAYTAGEDFSYLQLVGLKGDGMLSRIDLPALGTNFAMPIFIIQGKDDILTMPSVTKRYFDSIKAPIKKYVVLDKVGHDPNELMVDAQLRILKTQITPLLDSSKTPRESAALVRKQI